MLPKSFFDAMSNEEDAARLRLINEELQRLYPAVCVPDSPKRANFLRIVEEADDYLEFALFWAYEVMIDHAPDQPEPRSPRLHPSTVVEQLTYVLLPSVRFHSTCALDALRFLEAEARRIGERMNSPVGYDMAEVLTVVPLVPESILRESLLNVSLCNVPLAAAFRAVVEAVGLHTRLQENKLLVCSEAMAMALDESVRNCHQDPLWELSGHLPPKDRTLSRSSLEDLAEFRPGSQIVGDEQHALFNAHYLLYGEPEEVARLSSLLFDWHEKAVFVGLDQRNKASLEQWGTNED